MEKAFAKDPLQMWAYVILLVMMPTALLQLLIGWIRSRGERKRRPIWTQKE